MLQAATNHFECMWFFTYIAKHFMAAPNCYMNQFWYFSRKHIKMSSGKCQMFSSDFVLLYTCFNLKPAMCSRWWRNHGYLKQHIFLPTGAFTAEWLEINGLWSTKTNWCQHKFWPNVSSMFEIKLVLPFPKIHAWYQLCMVSFFSPLWCLSTQKCYIPQACFLV